MHNYMFRSRLGALAFAALVVIGAVSLVGTEGDSGTLVEASEDIGRQKAELDAEMAREAEPEDEPQETEISEEAFDDWYEEEDPYLSDEALIDDTAGEDTTPLTGTEPGEEIDEYLVSED